MAIDCRRACVENMTTFESRLKERDGHVKVIHDSHVYYFSDCVNYLVY